MDRKQIGFRFTIAVAWVTLGGTAFADADHHHRVFSAGEPGKAGKITRVIQITMRESAGKMLFVPERIAIKRREQVRFVLRNDGILEHEFVLATTDENLKHAESMKKDSGMAHHDDPNAQHFASKASGEVLWHFTRSGTFEYACLIPGHREAGMTGIVVVK